MARTEMIQAVKDGGPKPPSPEEAAIQKKRTDLLDPQRQFEILNPKLLKYELILPEEVEVEHVDAESGRKTREVVTEWTRHALHIVTEFSLGDITKRRIYDDVEEYCLAVSAELRFLRPELAADEALLRQNLNFLEAAMAKHKEALRTLISKVSYYPSDDPKIPNRRPSVDEIAVGLGDVELYAIGLVFHNLLQQKREERKKARAAVSATPQPSPSSSQATDGA